MAKDCTWKKNSAKVVELWYNIVTCVSQNLNLVIELQKKNDSLDITFLIFIPYEVLSFSFPFLLNKTESDPSTIWQFVIKFQR